MSTWTSDELTKIGTAEELEITTRRPDGTFRKPVPIWVVRIDDDLYVRSYRGPGSAWYRAAQVNHEAHISAGGVEKDVSLVNAAEAVNEGVDSAYRTKYRRYPQYIEPMLAADVRATTLKLVPRDS